MVDIPDFMKNNGNSRANRKPMFLNKVKEELEEITPELLTTVKDDNSFAYVNILRDKPMLVEWVKEEFFDMLDEVRDVWVKEKSQVVPTPMGTMTICNTELSLTKPPAKIADSFSHILYLRSADTNALKYADYMINKRIKELELLDKMYNQDSNSQQKSGLIGEDLLNSFSKQLDEFHKHLFS